ncbi:pilus assembly protein [Alphaproteobacteria bacterium GH1-50]|uniref:Pilus assembly protein n=1 Tax=Kangsaoukella pontilimi TaxID=2691042 RepID=A0A7C9IRL2_9RHOB|nr:TadE/TadG family type IV pilus assembly protein [Kangsaoukella pontilimi]MXQ07065.1 pilus assembly protein [Kangsaoukella pontilimi]
MFKKFRKAEDGTASIEFVFLFPLFITILSMSIEVAIYMARHVMLDRGVDIAVRELRLGTDNPPTFDEFKTSICSNVLMVPNCEEVVQVELKPVSMSTWEGLEGPARCRDVGSKIDPFDMTEYSVGANNELMMVRVCGLFRPMMPTTHLGLGLQKVGERYAMVVTTAFVNEPAAAAGA